MISTQPVSRWFRSRLAVTCAVPVVGVLAVAVSQAGPRSFVAAGSPHFTSPAPLAVVAVPFTISWQAPRSASGGYAVFVDLDPVAPGHSLRDLATTECKRVPTCQPTVSYLQGLGVYQTTSDQVSVSYLVPLGGSASRQPHPVHTATVVNMDSAGRRSGDLFWQVQFRV